MKRLPIYGPKLDNGKVGAVHELEACAYFIRTGFEVFRNVAASGKIDIVLLKDGVFTAIDVATGTATVDVHGVTHYHQPKGKIEACQVLGIRCFIYYHDGHTELV